MKTFETLFEALVACDLRSVLPADMYKVPPINLTTYGACINQPSAEFGSSVLYGLIIRSMRSELYSIAKQSGLEAQVNNAVIPVIDKLQIDLRSTYGGRLRPLMTGSNILLLLDSLLKNVESTMDKQAATAFGIGGILGFIKKLNIPFNWKLQPSSKQYSNPALQLFYAFATQVIGLLSRVFVLALFLRKTNVKPEELKDDKYKRILYFVKTASLALRMKLPGFNIQTLKIIMPKA
jgi:hypothetical protein